MKLVDEKLDVKGVALARVKAKKVEAAVGKLEELYAKKEAAEKIVRNLDREIEDYLAEVNS